MISIKKTTIIIFLLYFSNWLSISAQKLNLTLEKAIEIAQKQSFSAFLSKNTFLVQELNYESFKKMLYPTMSLQLTPLTYDRSISEKWDSEEELYKPTETQWVTSYSSLSVNQPIAFTGGNLYMSSSLRRSMTYYEDGSNVQNFITNPISIEYRQSFNTINNYKWKSKLEPLAFEEAKKQHIEDNESTSITTISLFYNLLNAESNYKIAKLNKTNADTLYLFGERKFAIGAISSAEFLRLKLRKVNAGINLETAQLNSENAETELKNFLKIPLETKLSCQTSMRVPDIFIPANLAIQKAKENNPDMLALQQKILQAEKSVKSANSQRIDASVSANLGLNQNQDEFSEAYHELRDKQGVSVSLSMPVIDWGENKRNIQIAKLNQQLVKESNLKREADMKVEVLKMTQEFNIQSKQVEAFALADSISKVAYDAVQKQFLLGKANIVDINGSYNDMQSAQSTYTNALRNFWLKLYNLRKICLYDFLSNEDIKFYDETVITD